jgi:elongation factor P
MALSNTDLRKGVIFQDGGEYLQVLKYDHVVSGRGGAVGKVKVKNLKTGSITIKSYTQNDKVEEVDTTKKTMQYLYSDDTLSFFMDSQTYEQISLKRDVVEDDIQYLSDGEKVVMLFVEEEPISVEIPKSVELKVEYTEPAVKGNTSSGAMKEAKLVNGLKTQVPLFIKTGDVVKINTDTGDYVSRAKQI